MIVSNHWGIKDKFISAGVFVDVQIEALRSAGVQVSIFDIGTNYLPWHLVTRLKALRQAIRDSNADLVHARYGTIVAMLSVLTGYRTIITFCGSDLHPGATISPIRKYAGIFLSNFASLFARGVICVSEELRHRLWWRRDQAVVIPDGVDLNLFTPGDQMEARNHLGWGLPHPIAIINAARDPKAKGLELAQQAIEVAKISIPDIELIIIKDIKPENMYLCYRAADVLVCASNYEGSPNVVKEALACNLPVVSALVGDVPERLSGVHPSALVSRDKVAMGNAIAEILFKRERSNGRQFVSDLNIQNIADKVIRVYHSVFQNYLDEKI